MLVDRNAHLMSKHSCFFLRQYTHKFYWAFGHSKGPKDIKEAMAKVESALTEVTKLTTVKDPNRLQIDFYGAPFSLRLVTGD